MELISCGSAVPINKEGVLITAAHVVTGRLPIRDEDLNDPDVKILAKSVGSNFQEYVPGICGFTMENEYMKSPLFIDLAILNPKKNKTNFNHLTISDKEIEVGQDVIMSGYPDDIELPFSFDLNLDMDHPESKGLDKNIAIAKQLLMIKSGMIGQKFLVNLSGSNIKETISGEVIYIDNVMHSGASGGPVINNYGELIGIILQRAITSVPYEETPSLKIPSGSTLAISPKFIQSFI